MKKTLRRMFLAIEVNLILWLAMLSYTSHDSSEASDSWFKGTAMVPFSVIILGFLFAAVIQHWAYYAVYKKAKTLGV